MPFAVVKSPTIIGCTGKVEGTYGAGGSLSTSTDGQQLAESPQIAIEYEFDGTRVGPPGTTGYQTRAIPNGARASAPFKVEVKGAGAAYSSSVRPSVDLWLRMMGFDAAVTTTSDAEKVVYTPTAGPVGYASGNLAAYARGELYPLTGAMADGEMGADDTGVVMLTANVKAVLGSITDQITPPAITYPLAAVIPPTSHGATLFTLGDFVNGNVTKWSLKGGREVSWRKNNAGLMVGRRTLTLDVTVETTALTGTPYHAASAIDPYKLFSAGTALAAAITIPGAQYNQFDIAMPAAQLMAPPQTDVDGDVVITNLSLQLNPSAANANDEVTITFD